MGPVTGNDDGTTGYGVEGTSPSSVGVVGSSDASVGVWGQVGNQAYPGGFVPLHPKPPPPAGVTGHGYVVGDAVTYGVYGESRSGGDGVFGTGANGVHGASGVDAGSSKRPAEGAGIWGESDAGPGVYGSSTANAGVRGISDRLDGVQGVTSSPLNAGVSATNTAPAPARTPGVTQPSGFGLYATSNQTGVFARGNPAGYFEGDVMVTGDVVLINSSGDVAEDFDIADASAPAEPGTVLVITSTGKLHTSSTPYDTRVAGVVAGAGTLKPAIVLQRLENCAGRSPIALVGQAFCKVDASFGRIAPGDLLTTSSTPGYAMKALDESRRTGAILGKALGRLDDGQGLIAILVTTQ
jgi:hypothetical protein